MHFSSRDLEEIGEAMCQAVHHWAELTGAIPSVHNLVSVGWGWGYGVTGSWGSWGSWGS